MQRGAGGGVKGEEGLLDVQGLVLHKVGSFLSLFYCGGFEAWTVWVTMETETLQIEGLNTPL